MSRRGLTMIEVLVALGLLSALMLTVTSWIQSTARASTLAEPMRWRVAAEAILQLIHDDLITGDFESEQKRNQQLRVMVENGSLRIRTRTVQGGSETGSTIHRYRFDTLTSELGTTNEPERGRHTTRLLLDDVNSFDCRIDEEPALLTVSVTSSAGQSIQRSYLLP